MKYQGVYKIENLINGKVYIGSSNDVESRLKRHFRELHKGVHPNNHLQRSFNKYGPECFLFEPIERLSDSDFDNQFEHEQYYIDQYLNNWDDCYNLMKSVNMCSLGEDSVNSKLTESDVIKIKQLLVDRVPQSEICDIFDIGETTVYDIKRGARWSHVVTGHEKELTSLLRMVGDNSPVSKLKESDVVEIKKLLLDGKSFKYLSNMFGVTTSTVSSIYYGNTWSHVLPKITPVRKCDVDNDSFDTVPHTRNIGELLYNAKFDNDTVCEIKRLLCDGVIQKDIAKTYDVGLTTISAIARLQNWKDIGSEYNDVLILKYGKVKQVSVEKVSQVKKLLLLGLHTKEIVEIVGVTRQTVNDIKSLRSRVNVSNCLNEYLKEHSNVSVVIIDD